MIAEELWLLEENRTYHDLDSGHLVSKNELVHSGSPEPEAVSETQPQEKEKSLKRKRKLTVNLKEFLEEDSDGKLILNHFQSDKTLNKATRSLLTRIIIKHFKDDALKKINVGQKLKNFHIDTSVFISLADEIELLFPGEIATTYFTSYQSENGVSTAPSGSLWFHYNYVKDVMRSNNLLENPKDFKKRKVPSSTCEIVTKGNEDLDWLLKNLEPWEDVRNKWNSTYQARKFLYSSNEVSVSEYINKFPCLKVQGGKELYILDFEKLYPKNATHLESRWSTIKPILIKQFKILSATRGKVKDVSDQALIHLLPTLEADDQDAVILSLLPLLIDIGRPGRKKKVESENAARSEKIVITRSERLETFVQHVELETNLSSTIEKLRNKLLQTKDTFQPMIFIVGPLLKIEKAVVVVDDHIYKVDSCLEALDLCLKIFFVLQCDYPKTSLSLWQFIQIAGFDISLPGDKPIASVKVLLGLVKHAFTTLD